MTTGISVKYCDTETCKQCNPLPHVREHHAIQGAHDMLREAAKHFRQLDQGGHAVMADRHADALEKLIGVND